MTTMWTIIFVAATVVIVTVAAILLVRMFRHTGRRPGIETEKARLRARDRQSQRRR